MTTVSIKTLDDKTVQVDTKTLKAYSSDVASKLDALASGDPLELNIRSVHMNPIAEYLVQYPDPKTDTDPPKPLPINPTIQTVFTNKWDSAYFTRITTTGVNPSRLIEACRAIKFDETPFVRKIAALVALDLLQKYSKEPKELAKTVEKDLKTPEPETESKNDTEGDNTSSNDTAVVDVTKGVEDLKVSKKKSSSPKKKKSVS
jgi:hypothetical protein